MFAIPTGPGPGRRIGRSRARALLGGLSLGVLIATALAGGGLSPSAARAQGASPCSVAPTPGDTLITVNSGGRDRTALVHVPPAGAGQALPVLVALHGAGQNGRFFAGYSGFSVLADAEGFIAVYPYATAPDGIAFWTINDHRPGSADDVQFISDLLDTVQGTLCTDPTRLYASGVSNGAGMAARLACALSGRLAAIAPVAGGYGSQPPCQPTNPVAVLEVHGTGDSTVPYNGTNGGLGAVRPYLGAWARRDGCAPKPRPRRISARVVRYSWSGCAAGTAVEHLEIMGGSHQLPGALPPDRGPVATISAPWLIWSFLRLHRHSPPFAVPLAPGTTPGAPTPVAVPGPAGAATKRERR